MNVPRLELDALSFPVVYLIQFKHLNNNDNTLLTFQHSSVSVIEPQNSQRKVSYSGKPVDSNILIPLLNL